MTLLSQVWPQQEQQSLHTVMYTFGADVFISYEYSPSKSSGHGIFIILKVTEESNYSLGNMLLFGKTFINHLEK